VSPELIEAVAKGLLEARYRDQNARMNLGITWEKLEDAVRQDYREQARAALAAIEASGTHAVAPVEPTREMKQAGTVALQTARVLRSPWPVADAYAAMLAARPKVQP
jgi:hypothetical protein